MYTAGSLAVAERRSPLAESAEAALEEFFGPRASLWAKTTTWTCLSSPDFSAESEPGAPMGRWLNESLANPGSPVVREHQGRSWLVLPVGSDTGQSLAATIPIPPAHGQQEASLHLARLFIRTFSDRQKLKQLQESNQRCVAEITHNLEELVFLRRLAEHLELAELSRGPWELAHSILPMLRESIRAESLTFCLAQRDTKADNEATNPVHRVSRTVFHSSADSVSSDTAMSLVNDLVIHHGEKPLVRNYFDQIGEGTNYPGIRNFVLVPVAAHREIWGWILAVNRRPTPQPLALRQWEDLSETEFGTVEVGLITSVGSVLAVHTKNIELLDAKEQIFVDAVRCLVNAIDAKDPYTCGHSERVAAVAQCVAREMGLDDLACKRIYLSGLLHDVGKIGISGELLRKAGRLTPEEYRTIQQHPDRGWSVLGESEHFQKILPGVLHHHEHYDGSGYPDGLAGEQIPLDARIMAVADAYDAMSSDRPYRAEMNHERVVAILEAGAGTQWDPQVVATFLQILPQIRTIQMAYQPRRLKRRHGADEDQ